MFRLGIISDVHSDIVALDQSLARVREMGCDLVVCAGDLVDGDSFPDEVIARLAAEEIVIVIGNHDRWALERARMIPSKWARRKADPRTDSSDLMYEEAEAHGSGFPLSEDSLKFLAQLPTSWSSSIEGLRVVMWHASFRSDMEGIYPKLTSPEQVERHLLKAEADVLIVGHTHEHFALRSSSGIIVNPGALYTGGMSFRSESALVVPAPGVPSGGTFAVMELPRRLFLVYRALDGELVMESRR